MIKNLTKNARRPEGTWGSLMIHKMNLGHARLTKWALYQLDPEPDCKALDFGCGGGKAVRRLLKLIPQGKVYGVDYSPLCIERALKENSHFIANGRADILKASVSNLPFRDHVFDLVTAIETIYFWPDIHSDLKEVLRVLKPGGRLAIICEMVQSVDDDPDKYSEVTKLLKMHIPSALGLKKAMLEAGFSKIRVRKHPKHGWLCVIGEK